MRLNSKILSILKESEEENLFKPRRIEPRKEQNKLERNKVENILKYVLDGHVKTILNIFREFIAKFNLTIVDENFEKNEVDTTSEYHDPKDTNKYWINIYIKAKGEFSRPLFEDAIKIMERSAWKAEEIANKQEQELVWEIFERKKYIVLDIDYNF